MPAGTARAFRGFTPESVAFLRARRAGTRPGPRSSSAGGADHLPHQPRPPVLQGQDALPERGLAGLQAAQPGVDRGARLLLRTLAGDLPLRDGLLLRRAGHDEPFPGELRARPERFRSLVSPLGDDFAVEGERYRRPISGIDSLPEDLHHWYQRKNLYLEHREEAGGVLFTPALVRQVSEGFARLAPLYDFLWALRSPSRSPSA